MFAALLLHEKAWDVIPSAEKRMAIDFDNAYRSNEGDGSIRHVSRNDYAHES